MLLFQFSTVRYKLRETKQGKLENMTRKEIEIKLFKVMATPV